MSRGEPAGAGGAGFLARWSRRKQQARTGGELLDDAGETADVGLPSVPAAEEAVAEVDESTLSDTELLAKYELPDPEALTASDDVAAFMRKGVPARLRSLALRRIWRLDPVLANLDGLNDYDDDYTDAAMLAGVVQTTYQVGKGGAAHLQDAADRLAAAEQAGPAAAEPEPEHRTGDGREAEAQEAAAQKAADRDADARESGSRDPDGAGADGPAAEGRAAGAHEDVVPDRGEAETAVAPQPEAMPGAPEPARRRRMVFARPDDRKLHTGS